MGAAMGRLAPEAMMTRHATQPITKPCPLHPDCTLILCRVRVSGDLPTGASLAITAPGIMPGYFVWAQSRIAGPGYNEATSDAYDFALHGRAPHPVLLCSVAEWQAACDAREAGHG